MPDPVKPKATFDRAKTLVDMVHTLPAADQAGYLDGLKKEDPGADYTALEQCYTATPPAAECLEKVRKGWAGQEPKGTPTTVKPGQEIAQKFFEWLRSKSIKLTGNREKDKTLVDANLPKFKDEYLKANPQAKGFEDAEEVLRRFFDTWESASLMDWTMMRSKDIAPAVEKWVGLLLAGALNGINLLNILPVAIKTDNAFLANPVVKFLLKIDFAGMNKDLNGPIQFKQAAFGMTGQLYSTSLLDGWIEGLDTSDQWKARLVLFLFAGLGAGQSNALQSDLLDTQFAENFMPDLRSTVENLVKYLLAHPDMGYMTDLHRQMKPVSPEKGFHPWGLLRTGMAVLIFMNAKNNSRFQVQGGVQTGIIGNPDEHKIAEQSVTFEKTFYGMYQDYQAKGRAMNMNNALFLADIFLATFQDALHELKAYEKTPTFLQYATPLASSLASLVLLRTFVSSPLVENPAKALGAESIQQYLAHFRINKDPDEIKKIADGSVEKINEAFLYGSLQGLLAGITDHPRETVDAFMAINNMAASTNLVLEHGAAESQIAVDAGDKDKGMGYSVTQTMGALKMLGTVSSLLAGFEAGKTAALASGNYLEVLPALYGLAIRAGLVMDADKLPDGKAKDDVVANQYLNLGIYAGSTLAIFGLHRFFKPVNLDFKFEGDSYQVAGKFAVSANGLALQGSFGARKPNEKSPQELLGQALQQARAYEKSVQEQVSVAPGNLLKAKAAVAEAEAGILQYQIEKVQAALQKGIIPFNAADKTQTALIKNQLKAPLLARQEQIQAEISRLAKQAPLPQPSQGLFRMPLVDSQTAEQMQKLEGELSKVKLEIRNIETTYNLAGLFKSKTGIDLNTEGLNPALKTYAQIMEMEYIVRNQLSQIFRLI